jgi:hypothetical protein
MKNERKDDFEPYWQDEKDWLCIVEFFGFVQEIPDYFRTRPMKSLSRVQK